METESIKRGGEISRKSKTMPDQLYRTRRRGQITNLYYNGIGL